MRFFFRVILMVISATLIGFKYGAARYDALVGEREAVRQEWAQIDPLLQRRYDLIPNPVLLM